MTNAGWAQRDAAVVWHGFTQMAGFLDECPVVVDRAQGHELVDVDGNRYLDAISSLWVTTLGHRVPALDDAVRAQLDRVAHSTLLGHGNTVVVELAEALAAHWRLPSLPTSSTASISFHPETLAVSRWTWIVAD